MDNKYENLVPWNGANDTGKDVRLKLERNFAKIGLNFDEVLDKLASADDLFALIVEELENKLSRTSDDIAQGLIDFLKGWTVGDKASIDKDGIATVQQLIALVKAKVAALEVTGNAKTNSLDVTETAKAKDVEVSNSVTTLNAVIQALAKTHDLTVDNTADIMNGIIRQYLSSESFVSGFLGSGFKIWKDENGLWHGEFDELTVRKTFLVFELVVQKIVHQGGMVIRSAAGGKLKKVTDGGTYWKCEHDSTDDFVSGDQVLCQTFTGSSMKRYWRLVTSAGAGYFNLSKTDCEVGSANPEAGDEVAVLGNRTVAARQSAQIDCAVGDNAPYRDDYAGINSYSLVGKLINRTGNLSGITDSDFGTLSGSGFYGINVYLKGIFRLLSGKTVETAISDAQAESNAYTDGKITKIETSFEIREGQISSKVTEATTAAKNADSSATLAQGYASTSGQKAADAAGSASEAANILTTVTQKETSINQTADAIELKAVRAESAAGCAETAEASINLKADGIVLQASNQAAKSAVNGVQVGGSNLIRNGSKFISTAYWSYYSSTGQTAAFGIRNNYWTGNVPAIQLNVSRVSGDMVIYQDIPTEIGQQYAFSCYIAGHRSTKSINIVGSKSLVTWNGEFILGGPSITDWAKPELVFTADTNVTRIHFYLGEHNEDDQYLWIKDIVCVKGNKVTGWTPAPEDVDASIALRPTTEEIKSQFTIDSSGISMMGKKIALTGLITFSSLATDAQSKITTAQSTADAANSTASSALASAGTANSGLNNLRNSLGALAYENTVSLAKLGTTIIEGGYLKTALIDVENLTVRNVEAKDSNGNVTCKINGATGDVKIKGDLTVQSLRLSLIPNNGSLKDGYLMLSSSGSYIAPELSDNEVMEVRFITPAWSRMVVSITLIPKNSNVRIGTTIWLLSAVNSNVTISGIGSILGFKRDGITYWIISYNEKD